jgi:hypothetical protein
MKRNKWSKRINEVRRVRTKIEKFKGDRKVRRRSKSSKEIEKFDEFEMSSKGVQNGSKCSKGAKMHIGREMSIIRGMHGRSRHVKKSKHAQLHAQSIPMRITMTRDCRIDQNGTVS